MYKKIMMSGLSVAMLAQTTLPTLAASVETKRMSEEFYDGLIQDLEQQIKAAEENLQASMATEVEVVEETIINEVNEVEDSTEEVVIKSNFEEVMTGEVSASTSVEVVESAHEDQIETYSDPASGSFNKLSVAQMREHIYEDVNTFLVQVEADRVELEATLLEEGLTLDKLESEVKAAKDGASILKAAADKDYGSGWLADSAAKAAMGVAHEAFKLVTNRWDNYKTSGWMEDYATKLAHELAAFEILINEFEEKVAADYEQLKDIPSVDTYKGKADEAIASAREFIANNTGKTGTEAKNALSSLNFVGVGAKAKFESAKSQWNSYVETGGVDAAQVALNKALDAFQVTVTEFNNKLEADYQRFQGATGIDEGYQAAKLIIEAAQKFIDESRFKTGSDAQAALNITLPIQKVAIGGAKEAWNLVINTILSDSLESIVGDLISWIENNATKVDYVKVVETVLDGLIAGKDAQTIINDIVTQVSGSVDVVKLTAIITRAVIWYEYNPEKDELIENIKNQIINSDVYQAYLKLVQAKEELEALKDYIESGQLGADVEAAIREEIEKIEGKLEALIQDLISQGSGAIKDQVNQLIKEVESFVNKIMNSKEFEQLKTLISLINQVKDYIESGQLEGDLEELISSEICKLQQQIEALMTKLITEGSAAIKQELAKLAQEVEAFVNKILNSEEFAQIKQAVEELKALIELIKEIEDYINSDQIQQDIVTIKGQINDLLKDIFLKTESQIRDEIAQIIEKLNATISIIIGQIEADLNVKLEELKEWVEKAESCLQTETGQTLLETIKVGITDLATQLETISDLIEDKKYCEAVEAKKAFIEKLEALMQEVKTLVGDKDLCKPTPKPEEPGDKPEEPGDKPEEPGDKPEEPGDKPEEPGDKPEEPGDKPEEPGDKPEEPGDKPEEPGDKPEEPGDKPEEPGDKPEEPGDEPEGEMVGQIQDVIINNGAIKITFNPDIYNYEFDIETDISEIIMNFELANQSEIQKIMINGQEVEVTHPLKFNLSQKETTVEVMVKSSARSTRSYTFVFNTKDTGSSDGTQDNNPTDPQQPGSENNTTNNNVNNESSIGNYPATGFNGMVGTIAGLGLSFIGVLQYRRKK